MHDVIFIHCLDVQLHDAIISLISLHMGERIVLVFLSPGLGSLGNVLWEFSD